MQNNVITISRQQSPPSKSHKFILFESSQTPSPTYAGIGQSEYKSEMSNVISVKI